MGSAPGEHDDRLQAQHRRRAHQAGQARGDGEVVEIDIGGCAGMAPRAVAQKPDVVGNHHRRFGGQQACPLVQRVLDPGTADFVARRLTE